MTFQLARHARTVMLMVPVCPESGFLGRAARPRPLANGIELKRHEHGITPYPGGVGQPGVRY